MNFKKLIISALLLIVAGAFFYAQAGNVNQSVAKEVANSFLKTHLKTSPGSLKAPAMADIMLTHAERSDKVPGATCYYIFNINGGGFIIVSGEDHATPVLGYSDKGHIDVDNMSEPLRDMLNGYKSEIEYLLTHDIKAPRSFNQSFNESVTVVEPLTHTTWGPEEPFYYLTPVQNGEYSVVGCVGVSMAQYVYFWRYPVTCDSLPSYYGDKLQATIPALPPTTFNFDIMLDSYGYWDYSKKKLVLGEFTEEQAYEVAKLCRYCGQAAKMNYSPSISTTTGAVAALKRLGYSTEGRYIDRSNYTEEEWGAIIKGQLDEDKAFIYAACSQSTVSHSFICDGYTNDDYYHMNLGWYGYNDGWYTPSAFYFVNRYGSERLYNKWQRLVQYLDPPMICTVDAEIEAEKDLLFLGENLNPNAMAVDLYMTYPRLPFMFTLTDTQGNQVAISDSITLRRITFEQGSDICLPLALPETLSEGVYDLNLNYRADANEPLTLAVNAEKHLYVISKFAKFGVPFGIADVIDAIDMLIDEDNEFDVNIADVTSLIDHLLDL